MQQSSSPLGPQVGWGVGLVGFVVTAAVGWLMDAGVGFLLVLLIFWGGIGGLFAFLVDRSTIEEHDRVDELQNTRLGKLGVVPAPVVARTPVERARPAAPATDRSPTTDRPPVGAASTTAGRRSSLAEPPVVSRPRSPRESREAKAEADRRRDHHAAA